MTTLSNTHPAAQHAAMQDHLTHLLNGVSNLFVSFSRAIAFSRRCEAEFSRQGNVSPETVKRLIAEV
ncbi:MAG: hypothetical protein GY948_14810 [Alphaproteobacteria bacterium]|nr:hypothetical protein [Alphaproteobacteria bacterium]